MTLKILPNPTGTFGQHSFSSKMEGETHGLSFVVACLFIVGEIAGTGVLAFPEALKSMGWLGIFVIVIVCAGAGYTGILLGKSWNIIEANNPALRNGKTRNPYALIGRSAFGTLGQSITTFTLSLQLFGGSVVLMLICAEMVWSILEPLKLEVTYCQWILILAASLLPLSLLGSPVDFWPVAVFAMSSTAIAAVLIIIAIFLIPSESVIEKVTSSILNNDTISSNGTLSLENVNLTLSSLRPTALVDPSVTVTSFLTGISTVAFGYGGASVLPTIQIDMKDKSQFTKSVILAFMLMLLIYLPVAIIGYGYFGNSVYDNVTRNLEHVSQYPWLTVIIQVLLTAHAYCAFLISINPVNLSLENFLQLHHSFNLKRCASRIVMMAMVLFVGLSIPKFGKLLNLVGAFAVSLQSFILPTVFYWKLEKHENLTFKTKLTLAIVLVLSVIIGTVSTVLTAKDLFAGDAFTYPCYIKDCPLSSVQCNV